jgi:hypothetical protein
LEPGAFKLWVNCICELVQPRHVVLDPPHAPLLVVRAVRGVRPARVYGWHSLPGVGLVTYTDVVHTLPGVELCVTYTDIGYTPTPAVSSI